MAAVTARGGWIVILVSVVALTLVWRVLPAGSPPIYDGQCIANPYETLGGSPAAQPATKTFPKASTFPAAEVLTGETPPQAQILMETGTFDNSTPVTVSHHAGAGSGGQAAERHHRGQRLPILRGQRVRHRDRTGLAVTAGVHHPAGVDVASRAR